MQIRNRKKENEKIELQMTPMIDIVFQLLVFFVMTFKIVAQEGDFNIRMPRSAPDEIMPEEMETSATLRLSANEAGDLTQIQMDDVLLDDFDDLHRHVVGIVGDSIELKESMEVEIVADFDLRYEFVMQAITSVSGYRTPDDQIVPLIQKINFSPPTNAP